MKIGVACSCPIDVFHTFVAKGLYQTLMMGNPK